MNNINDYHFAPVLEEMLCGDAMTVIGNIIDNPELLGNESK